jgi:glycosyltransferase involved in cell wall biosynthesis
MSDRIRLLHLIYGFDLGHYGGGAERFALALADRLDRSRFEVAVGGLWGLGTAGESRHIEALERAGIETAVFSDWVEANPALSFARSFHALGRFLKRQRTQIIHSHSQFGDVLALPYRAVLPGLKMVRTPHDGHAKEWRRRPLRRLLLSNLLYPLCYDAEIGVSQAIVRRLDNRALARALQRRALHIPNAIDLSRFQQVVGDAAAKRVALRLPVDAFVVGTVGRLEVEKGLDVLLQAFPSVLGHIPQAHLVLTGYGKLAGDLLCLARSLGISDRVHFLGVRSDVEEVLPTFDLFVSASRWEGLSTVIIESMTSGTPVVATAVGGTGELIRSEETGWLVPPEDPGALAEHIILAAQDPAKRHEVATRAKETVKRFSIEPVTLAHECLYTSLLGRREH